MESTSLDDVVDVIADAARMLILPLLKKMNRESGQFVFHSVSLFKDSRAVC